MAEARRQIVLMGTGGHAKVIVELLQADAANELVGCVAPESAGSPRIAGLPWLGDDAYLAALKLRGIQHAFVAVGDNRLRRKLCEYARAQGMQLVNAISPQANVSPTARLGGNIAIMHGANIGPDTVVEDGVVINSNASVDHDGHLSPYCHIGPGATLAGCVHVGEESFVATGSSVIPGQRIGDRALVGAGSVVIRSIPANSIAYGVPARIRTRANNALVVGWTPVTSLRDVKTNVPPQRKAG